MRFCYLGDDHLDGAAAYLAGIAAHFGLEFDHVRSDQSPPPALFETNYAAFVLSDYPAARWGAGQLETLAARVEAGAGLLMIGGWDSFYGRQGEYHRGPLVDVLPIVMLDRDDRRNFAQPCLVRKRAEHPIVAGLPWDRPPGIGGYNQIAPKPGGEVLLEAVAFDVHCDGRNFAFAPQITQPLLIVGRHGRGRTAALATDVAPHWVGGLVDWGDARMCQDVAGGSIEVGNHYARFFRQLLVWVAGGNGE